ncbi:MAG: SPOR domain-containing protein [Deltaproteobacteria bacterium]|nr:SPOR domain-containing protein [Deltaproteobacteria bacterium]
MTKEMIDLDRIREDYELHLGNREFKGIVAAAIVIGLLIFTAGFLVGRLFPVPDRPEHWTEADSLPTNQTAVSETKMSAGDVLPSVPARGGSGTMNSPAVVQGETPTGGTGDAEENLQNTLDDLTAEPSSGLPGTAAPVPVPHPIQTIPSLYTIQIGAFERADAADKLSQQLQQEGYPAYTMIKTIPGKGVWYRVRVGRYVGHDEAEDVMARLTERKHLSGFITLYTKPAEKK